MDLMNISKPKLLFIANPKSGYGKSYNLQAYIHKYLDHQKYNFEIAFTSRENHAYHLANEARHKGYYGIIAAGGDGTVNEIASAIVGSEVVLGILPLGSGNGLAYHLGIRRSIKKAFEVINTKSITKIDTGVIQNHFFINVSGFGLDAVVASLTKKNNRRGFLPYFRQTIMNGIRYPGVDMTIKSENGMEYKGTYIIVAVCNGSIYGFDFAIAPDANLVDGYLNVVLVSKGRIREYLQLAIHMFKKRTYRSSLVHHFKAKKLTILYTGDLPMHKDGESTIVLGGQVESNVNPLSLNIFFNK
jgi:YegS/Rv2252/BmrU family lipid kinase